MILRNKNTSLINGLVAHWKLNGNSRETIRTSSLTNGLISFYKMENDSSDSWIYGNDGTDTLITYSAGNGKLGNGAGYGVSSKIIVPCERIREAQNASFSFWIKSTDYLFPIFIFKGNGVNNSFDIRYDGTFQYGVHLKVYDSAGTSYGAARNSTGTLVPGGTWSHVVVTYDGLQSNADRIKIYIDGVLQTVSIFGSINIPTSINNLSGNVTIGENLTGAMDEVGIWSRTLTQAEVNMLYNRGNGQSAIGASAFDGVDTAVTYGTGRWDGCAVFNGTSSKIEISNNSSSPFRQTTAITYAYWIKIPSGGKGLMGTATASGNGSGGINITESQQTFTWTPTAPSSDRSYTSIGTIPADTWTHVVQSISFAGTSSAQFYINGAPVTTSLSESVSIGTPSTIYNLTVGDCIGARSVNGFVPAFGGGYGNASFDEVGIWNRTLTAEEVSSLYNKSYPYPTILDQNSSGILDTYKNAFAGYSVRRLTRSYQGSAMRIRKETTPTLQTGIQAAWKFEEGSGSSAIDSTGNGKTGTLVSGAIRTAGRHGDGVSLTGLAKVTFSSVTMGSDYTFNAWFKPLTSTFATDGQLYKAIVATQNVTWGFYYQQETTTPSSFANKLIHYDTTIYRYNDTPLVPGQWHMITFVCSGGVGNWYLNGVLDSVTFSGLLSGNVNMMGGNHAAFASNEVLDDVSIWNRPLTSGEIAELYNGTGLEYPFDEIDVGFSGTGGLSLDTQTITNFAGSDTAYVSKWYDQSGNGRDMIQADPAKQPTIVSSGTLVTKNGKPAVYSPTNSVYLGTTLANLYKDYSLLGVVQFNGYGMEWIGGGNNDYGIYFVPGTTYHGYNSVLTGSVGSYMTSTANININVVNILEIHRTNATATVVVNNTSSTLIPVSSGLLDEFVVNSLSGESESYNLVGYMQETILYPTNKIADRVGIYANIKKYFGL